MKLQQCYFVQLSCQFWLVKYVLAKWTNDIFKPKLLNNSEWWVAVALACSTTGTSHMDPGAQSSHCFPTSRDCLHILLYRCSRFPCTWMKPPEINPNNNKKNSHKTCLLMHKCLNYFSNSSTQQQLQVGSMLFLSTVNDCWLVAI